jgi:hypothetical protein
MDDSNSSVTAGWLKFTVTTDTFFIYADNVHTIVYSDVIAESLKLGQDEAKTTLD